VLVRPLGVFVRQVHDVQVGIKLSHPIEPEMAGYRLARDRCDYDGEAVDSRAREIYQVLMAAMRRHELSQYHAG
jgi:hypothetical protein